MRLSLVQAPARALEVRAAAAAWAAAKPLAFQATFARTFAQASVLPLVLGLLRAQGKGRQEKKVGAALG